MLSICRLPAKCPSTNELCILINIRKTNAAALYHGRMPRSSEGCYFNRLIISVAFFPGKVICLCGVIFARNVGRDLLATAKTPEIASEIMNEN